MHVSLIHSGENWIINGISVGILLFGEDNPENIKNIKNQKNKIHKYRSKIAHVVVNVPTGHVIVKVIRRKLFAT